MTRRAGAAALLVAGLVLGSQVNRHEPRIPVRADGRWILAADFHVHAFFGDVGLAPWDLLPEAERRGLDVIAVTTHAGVFAGRFNRWWSERMGGPLVLVGQEITSKGYHLVGAALERRVEPQPNLADTIRDVHAQGGVAIAAHPSRDFWPAYTPEALTLLDGFESVQGRMDEASEYRDDLIAFTRRVQEHNSGVAFIGSSDFHVGRELGGARTYIVAREYSEQGVLEAVRNGQTVAADSNGNLVGDPSLVAFVGEHLDSRRLSSLPRSAGHWLSTAMVWVGLLGLVLFDGRSSAAGDGDETARATRA
jgi:hypothetical protein